MIYVFQIRAWNPQKINNCLLNMLGFGFRISSVGDKKVILPRMNCRNHTLKSHWGF
jgi:hypothetical protein